MRTFFSNLLSVQLLLVFALTVTITYILMSEFTGFAESPSFGHKESRDQPFDSINMTEIYGNTTNCATPRNWSQPHDIFAADYFSDGKILNVTLWLNSKAKNLSLEYQDIPAYGIYIDADSNAETGWQGIDYQMEIVWNNGTWNSTLYQFSLHGEPYRIIKQENLTSGELYEIDYVLMALDLDAISSPDKYKIMFYAEDRRRGNCLWDTDFSSWINIPNPNLILSTTPGTIELRPDDKEVVGVQLESNTGFTPEISNYTINDNNLSGIRSKIINEDRTNTEPANFEIEIPNKISTGKYAIPIRANVTQVSTIPHLPIQHVNFGYSFEQLDLPITILRPLSWESVIINTWTLWGPIVTFIAGILTGKIGSGLWEIFRARVKKHNHESRPNDKD